MKSYRDLKDSARVWVYQAARPMSEAECDEIRDRGRDFVASWAAHGEMLDAAVEVFHGRFVLLFADEEQARASGCSIDRSVGFIRELEGDLGVSLLDWRTVVYRDGQNIVSTSREEFEKKLSGGMLGPETMVFNNHLESKGELENGWEVPLKESNYRGLLPN